MLDKRITQERRKAVVRRLVAQVLIFGALGYVIFGYIVGVAIGVGDEMIPGIEGGSMIVYNRLPQSISRGDLVLLEQEGKRLLRRAVAVGGDVIEIDGANGVKINGKIETTRYALGITRARGANVVHTKRVEPGSVYVLADNRAHASDSRDFGEVSERSLAGKVIMTVTAYSSDWLSWTDNLRLR